MTSSNIVSTNLTTKYWRMSEAGRCAVHQNWLNKPNWVNVRNPVCHGGKLKIQVITHTLQPFSDWFKLQLNK